MLWKRSLAKKTHFPATCFAGVAPVGTGPLGGTVSLVISSGPSSGCLGFTGGPDFLLVQLISLIWVNAVLVELVEVLPIVLVVVLLLGVAATIVLLLGADSVVRGHGGVVDDKTHNSQHASEQYFPSG